MQIRSITVNNFKSLVDFKLDLANFTCLIGLNGSGKSTVLQFVDFLSQLMRGDMKGWLEERKWKSSDLKSKLIFSQTRSQSIRFEVELADSNGKYLGFWKARFSPGPRRNRCSGEYIVIGDDKLQTETEHITIRDHQQEIRKAKNLFVYEGSILAHLKESTLPKSLIEVRNFFQNISSLDLLSPHFLRQRTRESEGSLGLGGQRLASFLHELGPAKQRKLVNRLKKVYPRLTELHAKALRAGWKQLEVTEQFKGHNGSGPAKLTTEARHINDGMLRLLAILAELETDHQFLLFDEIENGINPEIVEFVIDALVEAKQQVLVTTHSPMILNYLDDDVAKAGVMYLYKTPQGHTKSVPFFSIPSLAEKLTVMGPGEAFVDTNLTELADEIARMPVEES